MGAYKTTSMPSTEDWEHHFEPSRREHRRARKIAKQTDRSKYKLTDQQKAGTESLRTPPEHLLQGKVIQIRSQEIEVDSNGKIFTCTLRGALKLTRSLEKNLIIVGDNVLFEPTSPSTGWIHHVNERSSVLSRQEHLHRVKQQLVAANVDQVLITVSLAEPMIRPSIIDRYLIAAKKGHSTPIILINKLDLKERYPEEGSLVDECIHLYQSLGINAVAFSAVTGEHLDDVRAILKDKVSVFSGQSGTGKTYIINKLTGLHLKTGFIRAVGKGAHTTTTTRLIPLPFGGWCVDTPGMRSFGIFSLTKEDLKEAFPELFRQPCAFTNCWHKGEYGCSVPEAIANNQISPLRLSSYLSLLKAAEEASRK